MENLSNDIEILINLQKVLREEILLRCVTKNISNSTRKKQA